VLKNKHSFTFVCESNLVETQYKEVIMRREDIAYSKGCQIFKTHSLEVQAAMWTVLRVADSSLLQDMQSFLNLSVVQEAMRGDVKPVANEELFMGTAPLITLATDDDAFKMLEKLIRAIDSGGKNPTIIIKDKETDVTISQYLENTTNLTTSYVQSMIISLKRLTSRDVDTSRYMDLASNLASYNVSFSMFEMVEDLFEVNPDPDNALVFVIPNDVGKTLKLRQKCVNKRDFIVSPFSKAHYEYWCVFLKSMDNHRPGFSKLLCCMMYPFFLEDLVSNMPLATDELYNEVNHGLVQAASEFILEDQFSAGHTNPALPSDADFLSLSRGYDNEERYISLGVRNDNYGAKIWDSKPGLNEIGIADHLGNCPQLKPVIDLVSQAIHSNELLRVVRAQNDKNQDDDTNTSASPFVGAFENAYMRMWAPMLDFEPSEIFSYGDFASMPYHEKYSKTRPLRPLFIPTFLDEVHNIRRLNYIDPMKVFDSDYDDSIKTRYRKRWTKAYIDDDLYFVLSSIILVAGKSKNSMTVIRMPMFNSLAIPMLLLSLQKKVSFTIIPAKKAHDPFFYLLVYSGAKIITPEKSLRIVMNISLYFIRGVIERHMCYESYGNYYEHQWFVNRYRDWRRQGVEVNFEVTKNIKGIQYKVVRINPKERKRKQNNNNTKRVYKSHQTMLEQERNFKNMIVKPRRLGEPLPILD